MCDEKIRKFEEAVEKISQASVKLDEESIKTIDQLITELDQKEDFVYLVNCLQIIADIACCKKGLPLLEQRHVPEKLTDILNQDDPLVVPHVLKFFCRIYPTDLDDKYSRVLEKIFEYFQSDNSQLLINAIDFLAVLGRAGYSARLMLNQRCPFFRKSCLTRLGSILKCADTTVKVRALQCIVDLLEIHEDDPKEETSKLSESFYLFIIEGEGKMTSQILSLCRQPFIEVRIHAMLVVAIIAEQVWGQQELAKDPTFLPWLLNRSTEVSKESKEAKFDILKTLVKSSTASKVFKGDDYVKMRADFKNGPFHVGVAEEMQMAQQHS